MKPLAYVTPEFLWELGYQNLTMIVKERDAKCKEKELIKSFRRMEKQTGVKSLTITSKPLGITGSKDASKKPATIQESARVSVGNITKKRKSSHKKTSSENTPPQKRLTSDDVENIRKLNKMNYSMEKIGRILLIHPKTVEAVIRNYNYKHV